MPESSMVGKVVLVTGANQGIGRETALELARRGAETVLVCRSEAKGRAVVNEIAAAGGKASLIVADLASQRDVRRAAAEFQGTHRHLDVLVNNAGVLVPSRRTTVDGIEETLAINHLAPFLLTNLLLEELKKSAAARVVTVSSMAHVRSQSHLDDLQFTEGYNAFRVYSHSKLLNILFTYELARRLQGTTVTANCLHPGVIASGFGQTYGGMIAFFVKLARPFLLTAKAGAKTTIYCAASPEVAGVTGKYFDKCRITKSNHASYDEAAQKRLWRLSEELTATALQQTAFIQHAVCCRLRQLAVKIARFHSMQVALILER